MKTIITSGERFIDIDALACVLAYKQLLDLKNIESEAVLSAPLNESITPSILNMGLSFQKQLNENPDYCQFIIMDVSEPKEIATFVKEDNIIELFDHHFGFGDYWRQKLGDKSHIEPIGACATLIWEAYEKFNLKSLISNLNADLLYTAILSNTLYLKASITKQRDITALNELKSFTSFKNHDVWDKNYFQETEKSIIEQPIEAIKNDLKVMGINNRDYVIAQIELWESSSFVHENLKVIHQILDSYHNPYSFFTSPSISEGKNYIVAKSDVMKAILEKAIDVDFIGDIGITNKLWLRKEIKVTIEQST